MTVFERLHRPFERVQMPPLDGATEWLNSEPLGPAERQSLAGWGRAVAGSNPVAPVY